MRNYSGHPTCFLWANLVDSGSHWISIAIVTQKIIEYYDSLGLDREDLIRNLIKEMDPGHIYTMDKVDLVKYPHLKQQDSVSCGVYCCSFIKVRALGL